MSQLRVFAFAAATAAAVSFTSLAPAGEIDGGLEEIFAINRAEGRDADVVSALVFLWDQGDIRALAADHRERRVPFAHRNEEVVRTLRDTAALTQAGLIDDLNAKRTRGDIADFEAFWIANIVRVDATEPALRAIAERPDVQRVYFNMPIGNINPPQPGEMKGGGATPLGGGSPEGRGRSPRAAGVGHGLHRRWCFDCNDRQRRRRQPPRAGQPLARP